MRHRACFHLLSLAVILALCSFARKFDLFMELLITYDDRDEAELALAKIAGQKRLASDRDDNEVVYRLLGEPTWTNFYKLGMYDLPLLKELVDKKSAGESYDSPEHQRILSSLDFLVTTYGLKIPDHWL